MTNITLSVDEDVVKKVRRIALEQNTSLSSLVRDSLMQIAKRDDVHKQELVKQLQVCHERSDVSYGERAWDRDQLHER